MRDEEVPYSFPGTVPAGSIAPGHEELGAGESSGVVVRAAGRVMRHRTQGRVCFSELRDWSGSIQLFAGAQATERFEQFTALNLGDWIGVEGEIVRTRRGELSIQVSTWQLLAPARRGFGDKWRGVSDVEVRHRQREVDLWANEGVREGFLFRSRLVRSLRRQLDELGFVEVETPVLQPLAGGANAKPFVTRYQAMHADFSLRIATELYLKRLVVGGFERVYEIGKVFRNEGLSPKHNPEFTLLEAYQAYADYLDMAGVVEQLVSGAALELLGTTVVETDHGEIDLAPPWRRATMEEVITEVTGREATIEMGQEALAGVAGDLGVATESDWSAGRILYELYDDLVEHELVGPVHVLDYPEDVSPLTRRHRSRPGLVERLTPIVAGREIGEVYSELVDPDDQRARFVRQMAMRQAGDEDAMSLDEDFLRALEHGMPPTGGIGVGIDRLTMILSGKTNIREVILFPALRPHGQGAQDDEGASEDEASLSDDDGLS